MIEKEKMIKILSTPTLEYLANICISRDAVIYGEQIKTREGIKTYCRMMTRERRSCLCLSLEDWVQSDEDGRAYRCLFHEETQGE